VRGLEYDTMSGPDAEFVEKEVWPRVEAQVHAKLSKDSDARATMGYRGMKTGEGSLPRG